MMGSERETLLKTYSAHQNDDDDDGDNGVLDEENSGIPSSSSDSPLPSGLLARFGFYSSLFACQLFTQASLGNVLVPLSVIASDLGVTSPNQLPWFVAAYSLAVGAFILISGRLGDLFGNKRVYVVGMMWYGLCSCLLAGGAYMKNIDKVDYFIVFRALQGLGPAFTLPNGVALLAHAHPPGPTKSLVFALFGATAPLGFVSGAIVGSLFTQYLAWQYAQWMLGAACFVVALLAQVCVQSKSNAMHKTFSDYLKQIDILGATLGVMGLVCITYSLNQGPVSGWSNASVLVAVFIGIFSLIAFLWVESRQESPIMPPKIWSHKGFPGVMACIALGWGSFGIWMFYLVQFLQVERKSGQLSTALQMSPLFPMGLAATLTMNFLYGRAKVKGHNILTLSMIAFCVGSVLVAVCDVSWPYWYCLFPSLLIIPFGMDLSYPAGSLIVSNALPNEWQGVGASMMNTVVNISIAIGLGVAGTVQNVGDSNQLVSMHHAQYVGIVSSGLGILVAAIFCKVPEQEELDKLKQSYNH